MNWLFQLTELNFDKLESAVLVKLKVIPFILTQTEKIINKLANQKLTNLKATKHTKRPHII
jgi:hypothetical protein